MLVHDERKSPINAGTATAERGDLPAPAGSQRPVRVHPARRRRRWTSVLAVTGALTATATLTIGTHLSRQVETTVVSDGSYAAAEANRMETLQELSSEPASDDSYTAAEANRMETLQELSSDPASDDSYTAAEANRMETLRSLASAR